MKLFVAVCVVALLAPSFAAVDDTKLHVHIIAHSHCDAGYRETALGYYYDRVQHIIDNVVVWLGQSESNKFQWEEVYFFSLWWNNRNDSDHAAVRGFIANGQLEMIGGGWVMHDEGKVIC